jgi:hypothetical protein
MRLLTSVVLVALVTACGPEKGEGESGGSSGGETSAGTTSATAPTSEPTTDPTGTPPQTTCEDFFVFAAEDVAAGILLLYRYGNEKAGSDFQVFVDGSIFHREATCCPLEESYPGETALDAAALTTLKEQAAAVIAGGSETMSLGPMTEGQQTGVMCVLVNGTVGTVKAYELGADVTLRASTAPEAAAIAALVHGYTAIDMPDE